MTRFILVTACLAVVSGRLCGAAASAGEVSKYERPTVQLAILLDTSNSMDGLISQAKTQLWTVVNEFVRAKKGGHTPAIQVALFEYGKASLAPSDGFVRLILPLTDDLDRVSEALFALSTNGGEEYCGWAIRDAVTRLDWSRSREVYKAIFIAGNEPFTQGSVDFHAACKAAIEKGILVNTIFCGANAEGSHTGWKDGATLADGRYMSIDQDQATAEIATPQDTEIAKLGAALNRTYLAYGKMGQAGLARQAAQDANAVNASSSALVSRSVTKGNPFYCNDGWDLVDAIKNGRCKLDDLKDDELPPELRTLDKEARKAKVDAAAKERATIQARILSLNDERNRYLAAERKKRAGAQAESFDRAIVKAIRDQASQQKFTFE